MKTFKIKVVDKNLKVIKTGTMRTDGKMQDLISSLIKIPDETIGIFIVEVVDKEFDKLIESN